MRETSSIDNNKHKITDQKSSIDNNKHKRTDQTSLTSHTAKPYLMYVTLVKNIHVCTRLSFTTPTYRSVHNIEYICYFPIEDLHMYATSQCQTLV